MTTGESLPGSEKVRRLQSVLHAKAKEEPSRRFHALIDKVWREDFLAEAWRRVRRNGGAAGVDGETFAAIESYGVGRWLGELARERKTRCLRCPEEAFEFLGYRIGRIHRPTGKGSYTGTRPTKASVQSICRKVSELTTPRYGPQSPERMVERLNRTITGWANYFSLGHVSPAYSAVNQHAVRRLRQWLCRKHKVRSGGVVRFPDTRLRQHYGLVHLTRQAMGLPSAKA